MRLQIKEKDLVVTFSGKEEKIFEKVAKMGI